MSASHDRSYESRAMLEFLVIFTLVVRPLDGDVLGKYARAPGVEYHGRYTRGVPEAELLIPRRVFEDGSFSTYTLPSFYERDSASGRERRSASRGARLHLVLPFNGIDHHVELEPYHEFISPDMVVETRGAGIGTDLERALRFRRASDEQCHYRGVVRGHENSRAALSLCSGVAGYVQTNHGRYFVEPVSEAVPEPDGQHVHMAYKRGRHETHGSADDRSARYCGTSDNWELAWAEQLARRQKERTRDNPEAVKRAPPITSGTHSIHRYIELGLVADRRFLDFHNGTDHEQYLLTIMNMVSDFYHDSSAGNQIDVVVVRMIYLEKEKEEIDLLISPAAEETLASFAKWAEKMNPKDHQHPNHFDVAALVTRYDICSEGTNCDLMGLAYVAAACDPSKAAAINEDSGLLLGIVIAHEVGHVMGCSHDEVETSGCPPQTENDGSYHVMSPIVFIFTVRWSVCSRKFITSFLESGLGDCLNDDPRNPSDKFKYPNMLPGAMYDADFQCDMAFPGSTLCTRKSAGDCEKLWCLTNSTCYSRGAPKADGTSCGEKKWCIHKQCVDKGTRPAAVHGGWGPWGPMSGCSRTCGGGVRYSERECDKPAPANGGRYCIGERKKLATCNTTPCDPTKPPYRALQCAEFDGKQVLTDGLHRWTPYMSPDVEPCALYCINEKNTFVKLAPAANDSTPCKAGTNYMCLGGSCRRVGCDWLIDSDAIEDKCGVCNGDGTKCSPVEGEYTESGRKSGYTKVVTIPRGARSIHVMERKPSTNTLAVKLDKSDKYCLNSDSREQRSGDYECAGTMIIYSHPEPDKEDIEMKGPITEDVQIQYVFFDPRDNPGVRYKYYAKSANPSYTPKYLWDFLDWSECSVKCGGGTMISEASCIEEQGGRVTPNFCDGLPRPEPKSRVCNQSPCAAKWRVSQWSKCSACNGKKGSRHRKVQCVKQGARAGEDGVQANFDACKGRVPKQKEDCVGKRPCRKSCQKKTRDSREELRSIEEESALSPEDLQRMIDRFVDEGLARYANKIRSAPRAAENLARSSAARDFRRLLRDWVASNEGNVKYDKYDKYDIYDKYDKDDKCEQYEHTCRPELKFASQQKDSSDLDGYFSDLERNLKDSEGNFSVPELNLKDSERNFSVPERNLNDSEGNFSVPELNLKDSEGNFSVPERNPNGSQGNVEVSERNFSTPKPGSIVKDSVPLNEVVLYEAPFVDEPLTTNLSDKAFQEAGDIVGTEIDTSQEKTYKGADAVRRIEQLEHRDGVATSTKSP